jgi:hypothetical protein
MPGSSSTGWSFTHIGTIRPSLLNPDPAFPDGRNFLFFFDGGNHHFLDRAAPIVQNHPAFLIFPFPVRVSGLFRKSPSENGVAIPPGGQKIMCGHRIGPFELQ